MEDPHDYPQVGDEDVEPDALDGPGMPLTTLIAEFGAELDEESAATTPADGWRVLRRFELGAVIGAPTDAEHRTWRIARVDTDDDVPSVWVHDEELPLRPSRRERSKGLVLRWPAVSEGFTGEGPVAVDIVNIGSERWDSPGDTFHATGVLHPLEQDTVAFGWFAWGPQPALPLDPGEYSRVVVHIDHPRWEQLEPGRYDLFAHVTSLGLRTPSPLSVDLTAEVVERQRRRNRREEQPGDERGGLESHIAHLNAILVGASSLVEVAAAVAVADDDADAVDRIRAALACDEQTAHTIYDARFATLSPAMVPGLTEQIAELQRELDDLGPAPRAAGGDRLER
jgi:hypothetical protein